MKISFHLSKPQKKRQQLFIVRGILWKKKIRNAHPAVFRRRMIQEKRARAAHHHICPAIPATLLAYALHSLKDIPTPLSFSIQWSRNRLTAIYHQKILFFFFFLGFFLFFTTEHGGDYLLRIDINTRNFI